MHYKNSSVLTDLGRMAVNPIYALFWDWDGCIAYHLISSITNVKALLVSLQVLNMLGNVIEVISPRHCVV